MKCPKCGRIMEDMDDGMYCLGLDCGLYLDTGELADIIYDNKVRLERANEIWGCFYRSITNSELAREMDELLRGDVTPQDP